MVAGLALIAAQIPVLVILHSDASYNQPAMIGEQVPLVAERVPPNDVVGAVQSGTLAFMRDRVVNLDGRVNFEAIGRCGKGTSAGLLTGRSWPMTISGRISRNQDGRLLQPRAR